MEKLVRHLCFPLKFDAQRLQQDLEAVQPHTWRDHFNPQDFEGRWRVLVLMSSDGRAENPYSLPGHTEPYLPTPNLAACPYMQEVLDSLQFDKGSVRLLSLEPGSIIKPHTDHEIGYEDGNFRLHIPIQTNPEVEFVVDGQRLHMLPGSLWYINANFTHNIANRGTTSRIHLIVDGYRNAWTDELFFKEAPESAFVKPPPPKPTGAMRDRILDELKRNNLPIPPGF